MVARSFNKFDVNSKTMAAFMIDISALMVSPRHGAAQRAVFTNMVESFLNDKDKQAIVTVTAEDVVAKCSVLTLLPSPEFVGLIDTFKKAGRT